MHFIKHMDRWLPYLIQKSQLSYIVYFLQDLIKKSSNAMWFLVCDVYKNFHHVNDESMQNEFFEKKKVFKKKGGGGVILEQVYAYK